MSLITLVIAVVGAIMILNLGLKAWVFTKADQINYTMPCPSSVGSTNPGCDPAMVAQEIQQAKDNQTSQRQNTAAQAIAMIVVATPLWYYHWKMARKEA